MSDQKRRAKNVSARVDPGSRAGTTLRESSSIDIRGGNMQEVRQSAVAETAPASASVGEGSDLFVPREGGSTLVVAGKIWIGTDFFVGSGLRPCAIEGRRHEGRVGAGG